MKHRTTSPQHQIAVLHLRHETLSKYSNQPFKMKYSIIFLLSALAAASPIPSDANAATAYKRAELDEPVYRRVSFTPTSTIQVLLYTQETDMCPLVLG